jgi:hypothetical protein
MLLTEECRMTEREMREIVARVLRKAVRKVVIPATLGVGLSLAGCDSRAVVVGDETPEAGAIQAKADAGTPRADAKPQPLPQKSDAGIPMYGAPFPGSDAQGTVTLYGAPFPAPDADDNALYAAPFPAQDSMTPSPSLYAAPFPAPEAGPPSGGKYAAPFPPSGEKYAAPFP